MISSSKITALLLASGHAYASYYGGIGMGPFEDSSDGAFCPTGTTMGTGVVWCCPPGTIFNALQNSNILCCPTSADCTNDLLNSGVQCADPTWTLFKYGGSLVCCPSGYKLNNARFCVNTGSDHMYTSTAQLASLTPDGSAPTGTPASGSAVAPNNSAASTTAAGSVPTGANGSATPAITSAGGAATTAGGGATKSSSSKAAGNYLKPGAQAVGAFVAIGGLLV